MNRRKVQISAAHIIAAATPWDNTPGHTNEFGDLSDKVLGLERVLQAVLERATPAEQLELYRVVMGGTEHYRERYTAEFVAAGGAEEP